MGAAASPGRMLYSVGRRESTTRPGAGLGGDGRWRAAGTGVAAAERWTEGRQGGAARVELQKRAPIANSGSEGSRAGRGRVVAGSGGDGVQATVGDWSSIIGGQGLPEEPSRAPTIRPASSGRAEDHLWKRSTRPCRSPGTRAKTDEHVHGSSDEAQRGRRVKSGSAIQALERTAHRRGNRVAVARSRVPRGEYLKRNEKA